VALVIWLFAGGGEAELGEREGSVRGIVHFFEKHFPDFIFERITPVRNKRPPHRVVAGSTANALGKTGAAFSKQIKEKLEDKIKYSSTLCDAILVLDDLDCGCYIERKALLDNTINQSGNGEFKEVKRIVGFAAPELEAWLIADWSNTIAKHVDFKNNHQAMHDWLAEHGIVFDAPEEFSFYDPSKKACHDKLSELLIEASRQKNQLPFSKAMHTPLLIYDLLRPDVVINKCPIFRSFFTGIQDLNKT